MIHHSRCRHHPEKRKPCWPSLDLRLLLKVRFGRNGTHVVQTTEFSETVVPTSLQRPAPSASRIKHLAVGPCSELSEHEDSGKMRGGELYIGDARCSNAVKMDTVSQKSDFCVLLLFKTYTKKMFWLHCNTHLIKFCV